jgi:hypothetical protein
MQVDKYLEDLNWGVTWNSENVSVVVLHVPSNSLIDGIY